MTGLVEFVTFVLTYQWPVMLVAGVSVWALWVTT